MGKKKEPQRLWHATDHHTGKVLAYVCDRRTDEVCVKGKTLLEPFGITRYSIDYWEPTDGILPLKSTAPAKQQIKRKHLLNRYELGYQHKVGNPDLVTAHA